MAKTLIVKITCDQCNADDNGDDVPGEESVAFAFDGYSYSLDLCAEHAEQFHNTIQQLISVAPERERLGAVPRRRSTSAPTGAAPQVRPPARRDKEQLQVIRDWANANGFKVSNRGRIPAEVEAAYQASFTGSA